jgi:hypothetical protein
MLWDLCIVHFRAIAKRLASGTTSILAGEPGRPRLVTPETFVFVNGLGLGCDGYDVELDREVAEGKTNGCDGEIDSDVAETLMPDIGNTDGYDGELDSNVAEGKTDGHDGELDSDVAETSTSSDGYDGEPDIDLADMKVILEVDSEDACMVLAISNMATFCLEGNFSNGELPSLKLCPLRGTRILSNTRRTPTGVKLGNDAHTLVMTSGANVA